MKQHQKLRTKKENKGKSKVIDKGKRSKTPIEVKSFPRDMPRAKASPPSHML